MKRTGIPLLANLLPLLRILCLPFAASTCEYRKRKFILAFNLILLLNNQLDISFKQCAATFSPAIEV